MSNNELLNRFSGFIKTVVINARKDYLRKMEWRSHEVIGLEAAEDLSYSEDNLRETETFEFESQLLEKAFGTLSENRKAILELIFIKELKPSEVAEHLNCSISEVYQERYQAIRKLKKLLERMLEDEI